MTDSGEKRRDPGLASCSLAFNSFLGSLLPLPDDLGDAADESVIVEKRG